MASAAPADARVVDIEYPTKREEAWRYAPHRQLAELVFGPTTSSAGDVPADLDERIPVLGGPRVVIVNGIVDRERSTLTGSRDRGAHESSDGAPAIDGLHLASLADGLAHDSELASTRDSIAATDAFVALNLAHGTDGVMIGIEDGVVVDTPIHVVDVTVPGAMANTSLTGVVIDLGAGSSATVIETRVGVGTEFGGSNVLTTISVGDDATLEHVLLQDLPTEQIHLSRVEITQGARSTVRTRSFNLGAAYGRLAYHVELAGAGAFVDLSGLFFGVGDQILDQQLTVIHAAKDCTSRQSFRGVLDGASTGVFNGGIDVCPGADGTDAEQSNDNLLLSNRAEVNTQPRLEILADEVACKHGATVGQLDDTALYYLRSRGIGVDEARRLLVNGFADQTIDDVGSEPVRAWITRRLGHDHD